MGLVDDLRVDYGLDERPTRRKTKPVRKQVIVKYVPVYQPMYQPMYRPVTYTSQRRKTRKGSSRVSSWAVLKEKKGARALREFERQERREKAEKIARGFSVVGGGLRTVGSSVKKKAGDIKRVGWKGVFKSSIY